MRTLVWKEVRENVKLAALGGVIHTLLLVGQYRSYVASPNDISQPLATPDLLWTTIWFCGIFGAVLGWLQIHNERRPDLWAFLLHRPLTRTQVFLAKTLAGLGIYTAVVALPLLGFIIWALWPGHVAAPFELRMLRPLAATLLSGTAFYFAGMLTGLRQARWYGSRALSLGMALIVCVLMNMRPVWWQGFLVILVGVPILGLAAWGAFQTHGNYHRQPVWGKASLTFATMLGCMIVALVAAILVSNLFPGIDRPDARSNYVMTPEGVVCKVTDGPGDKSEITDLKGKPLLDEKTRQAVALADFNRRMHQSSALPLDPEEKPPLELWVRADLSPAFAWQKTADTRWFYWQRYGRLVGYDILTRRCIGSLGPNGFAKDLVGDGSHFGDSTKFGDRELASTETTLYRLDLERRTIKPVFTTTTSDPLQFSQEIKFEVDATNRQYIAVVTKQQIHLLSRDGQPIWKVSYDPQNRAYRQADIHFLDKPGQYALWMAPNYWDNVRANWKLPTHVIWLARDQGILKTADLPALPHPPSAPGPRETLCCAVTPPLILSALPYLNLGTDPPGIPHELLMLNWAGALVICLPVGVWLGRRYRLPLAAQLGWAVFVLLFGVPGLLAFLSVQEWPARVACSACKRPRLVDRPQCEHCGADFPPPEKTGTEIFAPLVASA
jgi:hypothetical protein